MVKKIKISFLNLPLWIILLIFIHGNQCTKSKQSLQPFEILQRFGQEEITAEDFFDAVPRLEGDTVLFRLRGGRTDFLKRYTIENNDTLQKTFIIGASFFEAQWEWDFFRRNMKSNQKNLRIRNSIVQNLFSVIVELESIGAPHTLLKEVDELKENFEIIPKEIQNVSSLCNSFERISNKLAYYFMSQQDLKTAFTFGNWSADMAQLTNLCLKYGEEYETYLIDKMNTLNSKTKIKSLENIIRKIFGDDKNYLFHFPKEKFPLRHIDDVMEIRSYIHLVFQSMDMVFPKLL